MKPSAIDYEGSSSNRESFAATLGLAERCPPASRWVCGPVGFGLHVLAIAALVGSALFSPIELLPPQVTPLRLNLAPPPPPPIRSSAVASSSFLEAIPVSGSELIAPGRIPDEILSPRFEVTAGLEVGFLDGSDQGLPGGIPGGVVGGNSWRHRRRRRRGHW